MLRQLLQLCRYYDCVHKDGFFQQFSIFCFVDGKLYFFALQDLGDLHYAKAKRAMPVPMSPDTSKDTQIKWLASLGPSDIAQFNFKTPMKSDIPEAFRAVTMCSGKIRKLGEKDDSPIVSLDANETSDKDPIVQLPPVED